MHSRSSVVRPRCGWAMPFGPGKEAMVASVLGHRCENWLGDCSKKCENKDTVDHTEAWREVTRSLGGDPARDSSSCPPSRIRSRPTRCRPGLSSQSHTPHRGSASQRHEERLYYEGRSCLLVRDHKSHAAQTLFRVSFPVYAVEQRAMRLEKLTDLEKGL